MQICNVHLDVDLFGPGDPEGVTEVFASVLLI